MCQACERRTRPDAAPMCPSCWDLRAKSVTPVTGPPKHRLQNLGLGFGIASLLPLWPVILTSLVLNIVALVKASGSEELKAHRWKPIVGLVITVVAVGLWVLVVAGIAFFAK